MTGETAGVDIGRVAEVMVTRPEGGGARASGYLVRSGCVLTVRHVLERAGGVEVRFNADRPDERRVSATVLWEDPDCDVAVLGVPDGDRVPPARFGRIDSGDGRVDCRAVGFPAFKLRSDRVGPGSYRDSHDAHGHIAVLSNRRERTFELTVAPPQGVPGKRDPSPWGGMSGAAVWVGDRIVGVVARHYWSDGPGRLAAVRVDAWAELLTDGARLAALERLLGVPLAVARLPRARTASASPPYEPPLRPLLGTASAPGRTPEPTDWHGGDKLSVGARTYVLLDGLIEHTILPQPPLRTSQGQALRTDSACRHGTEYAWVRRTEQLGPRSVGSGTTAADGGRGTLGREHRILTDSARDPRLPHVDCFVVAECSETLALTWPTTSAGAPCPTLRQRHGGVGALDTWRLGRLLAGISALCTTVAHLHAAGLSHRLLGMDAIIIRDEGTLVLRDLGLAAHPPRRGEAPADCQAPEQQRNHRGAGPPGTATDVFQLAAVIYRLAFGRAPIPGAPVPARVAPGVFVPWPRPFVDALRPDAARRPSMADLGAALAAFRDTLPAPRRSG